MSDSSQSDTAPPSDTDLLIQQIADLQTELNKARDMAARAQADLQNAKARGERDAEDLRKFAAEGMIRRILPTLDNFQRAFQHIPDDVKNHEWVKGVSAIEANLMKEMSAAGLKRLESLGAVVNPELHEVLALGTGECEKVVEVFEEGYELHGKVIRHAKVKAGDGSVPHVAV